MNFWEFADKNGFGLFWVAVLFIGAIVVIACTAIER